MKNRFDFYSKILWFKEFKVFYIFKEKLLEDVSKVNNKTCKTMEPEVSINIFVGFIKRYFDISSFFYDNLILNKNVM